MPDDGGDANPNRLFDCIQNQYVVVRRLAEELENNPSRQAEYDAAFAMLRDLQQQEADRLSLLRQQVYQWEPGQGARALASVNQLIERHGHLLDADLPTVKVPKAIPRRHTPKGWTNPDDVEGRHHAYRACLRFDAGFTCPFCLVHESDLAPRGAERSGLFTVEHRDRSGRRDDYTNCVYACRYCNGARGTHPLVNAGGRLLDPTADDWDAYFAFDVATGSLQPTDDPDARRTWSDVDGYNLDDPVKVGARLERFRDMTDWLMQTEAAEQLPTLLRIAERTTGEVRQAILYQCERLQHHTTRALHNLARRQLIPEVDAPGNCRCGSAPSPPTHPVVSGLSVALLVEPGR